MSWKTLGTVAPTDLVDARLQLHHAAQVVASAGVTFLDPEPDDSHPNFGWVGSIAAFVGRPLPGAGVRAGLRVSDLSLLIVDASGEVSDAESLDGRTLDEAYAWLGAATARAGSPLPAGGLTRARYDIPSHPTGGGAPFACAPGDAFVELSRWFDNGHAALTQLAAKLAGASDVRCWPHHFDLGALVVEETAPDGSLAKSIGIGLSPGDDGYAEPYWYVSPWPYPAPDVLEALEGGGHWHTEGYTSAILTGSDAVQGAPENQSDRLQSFLASAVGASRRALAA